MPIVIKMEYEKFPPRYYQRRRNKRSSGSAEWHSRSPRLRALQAVIGSYIPCGIDNWRRFQRDIGAALGAEE